MLSVKCLEDTLFKLKGDMSAIKDEADNSGINAMIINNTKIF